MTDRQIEELAKFCLDVSKLLLGSWVLGLFTLDIGLLKVILMVAGLTFSASFFMIGIRLFKEVK